MTCASYKIDIINDEGQFAECWNDMTDPIQKSWYTFDRWISIYNHDIITIIRFPIG